MLPTEKLYHIMLYRVHLTRAVLKVKTLVVIGIYCIQLPYDHDPDGPSKHIDHDVVPENNQSIK